MYELEECLKVTREIKEVDELIEELQERAMSPKSQKITGMPRGGSIGSQNEDYLVKKERLLKDKDRLMQKRKEIWNKAYSILKAKGVKGEYIYLMQLRFYNGLNWNKCCDVMNKKYPDANWNINKIFRTYRNIAKEKTVEKKVLS